VEFRQDVIQSAEAQRLWAMRLATALSECAGETFGGEKRL